MNPAESARLAVLKSEIRRLAKQFQKKKSKRDGLSIEAADLKRVLDALVDEKDALEQGQLMLRECG